MVLVDNPKGRIANSDLEMARLLLIFLVMKVVCTKKQDARGACELTEHQSPNSGVGANNYGKRLTGGPTVTESIDHPRKRLPLLIVDADALSRTT